MTFKELGDIHPQILEKCRERAIEQGGKIRLDKQLITGKTSGGFNWSETIEYKKQSDFWNEVLDNQNFYIFYRMYPLKPEIPEIEINYISSDKSYKASFNGKNYEITIKEI